MRTGARTGYEHAKNSREESAERGLQARTGGIRRVSKPLLVPAVRPIHCHFLGMVKR